MRTYIVKVTTQSGYMLFTVEAESSDYAVGRVSIKMRDAGWNDTNIEVIK